MFQEIYVIDEDDKLTKELNYLFKDQKNYKFRKILTKEISIIVKNMPQLIIINDDNVNDDIINVCRTIRENYENNITPIIVYSSNEEKDYKMNLAKQYVEYYVPKSMGTEYLYYRIRNIFRLLVVNRTISPLTGLPGNVQIQSELRNRLLRDEEFIVLYLDLDNFKSFNDVYGFVKGDEIIKFTARTIIKHVNQDSNSEAFIGHIGGDDFVAILGRDAKYNEICQNIIKNFDLEVKAFFSEEDLERGYLKIQNRRGKMEKFPITSISIGVVIAEKDRFTNILEIGEVGAQVKHIAKKYKGSCYAIDKRKH